MLEYCPGVRTFASSVTTSAKLPSFFIIGPPRTGTSWLQTVVSQTAWLSHPTKETRFFDRYFDRGTTWYCSHFEAAVDSRVVGEVAPTYFASPIARDRMARMIPGAKIVCIFRNPVDRVLSLYRLKRAYGWISWEFEDALRRDSELTESSRYADHLKGWFEVFGSAQVLATLHDDMEADPQLYLDTLLDFIGAKRIRLQPAQLSHVLASDTLTQPRNYYWTRGALWLSEWSKKRGLDGLVAAAKSIGMTRAFIGGGTPFPELTIEGRERLRQLFRPEVEKLEAILNRDLSSWK